MTATITLVLGLLVVTVVFASAATRLGIPYAILLVLAGALLGFLPGLPTITLNPDLILFLFLPPLVYSSAWLTSWRAFRANLVPILSLSIGLVLFTTICVAAVAHLLLGLPWAVAFVLGAVLSPTDAVAASAIAQRVGLSRSVQTIVEGESMVNDATGLVVYTFAVAAAVSGSFSLAAATLQFVVVSLGGLACGLIVAWPLAWLHRHLDDAPIEITITLLTPFAAYLLAQTLQVSGVLAVLAAGLFLSYHSSHFFSSTTRLQANAVWNVLIFLLNGLLFLLIGLQLHSILTDLGPRSLLTTILQVLLISGTVIVVRFIWVFLAGDLRQWLTQRLAHNSYNFLDWRSQLIVAWTGLRGGISLAAALAIPLVLANGQPFPERDLIIALTFGVILVTLVGQGLSLIPLIGRLNTTVDETPEHERQQARLAAAKAALARIQQLADQEWVPETHLMELRARYEEKAKRAHEQMDGALPVDEESAASHRQLHHEIINAERSAVIRLRDQGKIDDEVLREMERELDLEEQRFQAGT